MISFVLILCVAAILATQLEVLDVVKRCIANDNQAKRLLYDHLSGKIMAICRRYCKEPAVADDVFQDSFIRIFDKLSLFDSSKGEFEGWAYRVSVNVALKHIQKEKKYQSEDIEASESSKMSTVHLNDSLTLEELRGFIAQLPEKQRTVFNMYVIDGYNHQEIAEQLNISVGTSKSQLSRAKETLRNMHQAYNQINESAFE